MCRAKGSDGRGRRCSGACKPRNFLTDSERRAKQASKDRARKWFGANNAASRAKVVALPEEFMGGRAGARAEFVADTDNADVLALAENDVPTVRASLVMNPNVSAAFLDAQADTHPFEVVANPATSDKTLNRMVEQGRCKVRPAAAEAMVERGLSLDAFNDHESTKVRTLAAIHTNDPALRDALLADPDVSVREGALLNDNVHTPLPESLAKDPSVKVRALAARRATAQDEDLLRTLAVSREDDAVAMAARANPNLPDGWDHQTVKPLVGAIESADARHEVMSLVTDPRTTSTDLEVAYASDRATQADRLAIASNPNATPAMHVRHFASLPKPLLAHLAKDSDDERLLNKLATSRSLDVRTALADNPSAPSTILKTLSMSESPEISSLAKRELARR